MDVPPGKALVPNASARRRRRGRISQDSEEYQIRMDLGTAQRYLLEADPEAYPFLIHLPPTQLRPNNILLDDTDSEHESEAIPIPASSETASADPVLTTNAIQANHLITVQSSLGSHNMANQEQVSANDVAEIQNGVEHILTIASSSSSHIRIQTNSNTPTSEAPENPQGNNSPTLLLQLHRLAGMNENDPNNPLIEPMDREIPLPASKPLSTPPIPQFMLPFEADPPSPPSPPEYHYIIFCSGPQPESNFYYSHSYRIAPLQFVNLDPLPIPEPELLSHNNEIDSSPEPTPPTEVNQDAPLSQPEIDNMEDDELADSLSFNSFLTESSSEMSDSPDLLSEDEY